jgi:hypothetical protein
LHSLLKQTEMMAQDSFDSAVSSHQEILTTAETLLTRLGGASITGHLRDFTELVDVNRAALGLFSTLRGPVLRREWGSI